MTATEMYVTVPVPYSELVGAVDPLALLASTPEQIARLVEHWPPTRWSLSYSEGKWSGAQILLHSAHDEIGWSDRIRLTLSVRSYVPVPYDGAEWVSLETPTDPNIALNARGL